MTNKQLRSYYRRYNKKWFAGKLPDLSVRFHSFSDKRVLGDTVFFGSKVAYVLLSKQIKNWDRVVQQILLHEMVHVSLPVRVMHGLRFEARMRRLARQRAFSGLW